VLLRASEERGARFVLESGFDRRGDERQYGTILLATSLDRREMHLNEAAAACALRPEKQPSSDDGVTQ
jgi:hypothetical protein